MTNLKHREETMITLQKDTADPEVRQQIEAAQKHN
jgi:hypothetical protein